MDEIEKDVWKTFKEITNYIEELWRKERIHIDIKIKPQGLVLEGHCKNKRCSKTISFDELSSTNLGLDGLVEFKLIEIKHQLN